MRKENDLVVMASGKAIAASKSCTIQESCETKEAGMKGSGQWKQYIAGRKSWTVETSFLVGNVTTIKSLLLQTGTKVTLSWKMRGEGAGTQSGAADAQGEGADTMTGTAIVTACKISGTRGSLVQGSFTFKGTGELR